MQYHTHATMTLYKENERLIEENHEHLRTIEILREIKTELEQKNYMYQKTLRILVHKLREKENQLASTQTKVFSEMTKEQRQDEEEFQELLIRAEHLKDVKKGPKPKQTKEKGAFRPESSQKLTQEAAIEFLYACLEDMELETFTRVVEEGGESSEVPSDVPLNQLNMKQRHDLLKSLLKRATAVRVMTQSLANATPAKNTPLRHVPYMPLINQASPSNHFSSHPS